jgi:hypothetical protein
MLFFLLPSSSLLGGVGFWFLVILTLGVLSLSIGYEQFSSKDLLYLISFFVFYIFTVIISIARSNSYIIADDLLELLRVFSLLVFLLCGYFLSTKNTVEFLLKFFVFFLVFQLIISIFQKIEPIKNVLSIIWNMDKAWILRSTGTLGNPNVLALMCIFSMLFIHFFSDNKKQKLYSFFVCSVIVLISGSRTGLIGYLVVVMFTLFISGRVTLLGLFKKSLLVLFFVTVFVITLTLVAGELRYMGELLKAFDGGSVDLTKVGTFNHRLGAWERQLNVFANSGDMSILIGMGPAKGEGFRVMDNDYLAQYLKYGLVGVMSNLLLLFMLAVSSFNCKKSYPGAPKFMISTIVCYSVFAITASTFLSLLNMIPVMLISGFLIKIGFEQNDRLKENNNNMSSTQT